jgi:hypothetical protein
MSWQDILDLEKLGFRLVRFKSYPSLWSIFGMQWVFEFQHCITLEHHYFYIG